MTKLSRKAIASVAHFDSKGRPVKPVRFRKGALAEVRTPLAELLASWVRGLDAAVTPASTVKNYRKRVKRYIGWCEDQARAISSDAPAPDTSQLNKATIETYLGATRAAGGMPASVLAYYAALNLFCAWCVGEGELTDNPVAGIKRPRVPRNPPAILSDDQLRALLRVYSGADFFHKRNLAILWMLMDTGLRRGEVAQLLTANVDLAAHEVSVIAGKGEKNRRVAIHNKTAAALDKYLRIRVRHPDAGDPHLWLGRTGPITDVVIWNVVRHAGKAAGIPGTVHPHQLRHAWAHHWLAEGGQEHALAKMAGWSNTDMAGLYGAALAEERAREAAKKMQGSDRL